MTKGNKESGGRQAPAVELLRLEVGPWPMNCYILTCKSSGISVVVDPGADAQRILAELGGQPVHAILLTHGHFDPVGAVADLQAATGAPVAIHAGDAGQLPVPPNFFLNDDEHIVVGGCRLNVIYTPGHTPGSVTLWTDKIALVGDTLFPGGPGHTESPQAFQEILTSITHQLFTLPDDTVAYPGHGPLTTIGAARAEYAAFAARAHPEDLHGDVTWTG